MIDGTPETPPDATLAMAVGYFQAGIRLAEAAGKEYEARVNGLADIINAPANPDVDLVRVVAEKLATFHYRRHERENTQCLSEFVYYLWDRWKDEAEELLTAIELVRTKAPEQEG